VVEPQGPVAARHPVPLVSESAHDLDVHCECVSPGGGTTTDDGEEGLVFIHTERLVHAAVGKREKRLFLTREELDILEGRAGSGHRHLGADREQSCPKCGTACRMKRARHIRARVVRGTHAARWLSAWCHAGTLTPARGRGGGLARLRRLLAEQPGCLLAYGLARPSQRAPVAEGGEAGLSVRRHSRPPLARRRTPPDRVPPLSKPGWSAC